MILQTRHLTKNYFQGSTVIEVLKDINLNVVKNETIAILGQSGSGKSTLLALLAGLDEPSSGEVLIADVAISKLSKKKLTEFRARHLGIIFQQFHLLSHLTAIENVSLPLELLGFKSAENRAEEALERVGLLHRKNHLVSQLSGGECQRVAIARAVEVRPQILLADEPSGSLDRKTGSTVMELLFDLVATSQMALVLVTHNDELANRCTRKFILDNSTLIESKH